MKFPISVYTDKTWLYKDVYDDIVIRDQPISYFCNQSICEEEEGDETFEITCLECPFDNYEAFAELKEQVIMDSTLNELGL